MAADEFERLIAGVQERMVASVWRIVGNAHETDDVVQETLVQVWRRFGEIRRHPNPSALLLRIGTQRALDHLRRRKARAALARGVSAESGPPPETPVERAAQNERRERILSFISRLPAREAEAITLHALEELSYAEAAAAMGCREVTVRVLVGRARKRFHASRAAAERSGVPGATGAQSQAD